MELFLARNHLGHIQLTADLRRRLVQVNFVATLGQYQGGRDPRRPGTHNGESSASLRSNVVQFHFVTSPRVHQATAHLVCEGMIQAGLVAGNAHIDLVGTPLARFLHELRIGQHWPRQRDHVGATLGQYLLRCFRQINTIGSHQRNGHFLFHLFCHPGEGASRY